MDQTLTYDPDFVSPPGDTIQDILDDRGLTQSELSERTGLARKTINEIVKGKAPVTPDTALHLERVLGVPARFWNEREALYQSAKALRAEADMLEGQSNWVRDFPYNAMAKLGMVREVDSRSTGYIVKRGRELLSYFQVGSPDQWRQVWMEPSAAFRRSLKFTSDPAAVSAWLRFGERAAQAMDDIEPFDEGRFRTALRAVREMTPGDPAQVIEMTIPLCAQAGVAVVLTPQLPGARISGATLWVRSNRALIQLSLRYKTDDHFWFTFFHEAAHVLLHGKRDVFLEGAGDDRELDKEAEANDWAARFLIPSREMAAFLERGEQSRRAVVAFARDLGIAPGIVVGQLQHRGYLGHEQLNGLKRPLEWV